MFKSSAVVEKSPPSWNLPALASQKPQQKEKAPADPSLSDPQGSKPLRDAGTLGQELARYLQESPSREGVIERLAVMAHFGIHTLDLSGQVFSAEAVLLLSEVFTTRPTLLGNFVAFNFADTRFDIVWPLLDVMQDHQFGVYESLDFSGTRVLVADALGTTRYAPLEDADLRRIVAMVKRHFLTLCELKLNQQTGLSPPVGARQLDHFIDPSSPMFALASALHQSAVETLELRDCDLWAGDVNYLDPDTLFRGQPAAEFRFRVIDLRGNDKMFGSFDSPILQVEMVVGQAVGLASNPSMSALYLPWKALAMLDSDAGVATLVQALEQKASHHLFKLEPFSSSGVERFLDLHRLLGRYKKPMPADQEAPWLPAPQKPLPPVPQEPPPKARLEIIQSAVLSGTKLDGGTAEVPVEPLNATTAGKLAAFFLGQDELQGMREFGKLMIRMRDAGIKTLDLSRQRLNATAVDSLAAILERTPRIMADWVTELNFSGAKLEGLEGLRDLLEALKRNKGGAIVSLDFSGTRVGVRGASGATVYREIPRAVLIDIAGLASVCPKLRILKLNHQPGLSDGAGEWNGIDRLYGLTEVLGSSGLETLEIRACVRTLPNPMPPVWQEVLVRKKANGAMTLAKVPPRITCSAPLPSKTLRRLDLRDNEAAFSGDPKQAFQQVIQLVKRLSDFASLQEVYLPSVVIDTLNHSDDLVFELLFALMESGHPNRFKLRPLSGPEGEIELSLENMLDVLNTADLRTPVVSSSSPDVYVRLHGGLSALCRDPSPRTEDRRRRLAEAVGCQVMFCFRSDRAQEAIKRLLFMTDLGIKILCLNAAILGEQQLACLAHVLHERPGVFTSFDFSEASMEWDLLSLVAILKRHRTDIESLDFSWTSVHKTGPFGPSKSTELSAADLIGVFDLVRECPKLRVLKLDHQPQLSRSKTQKVRLFCTPADWPMMALVEALESGSVERLSLQFCDLQFEDLQQIYAYALPVKGSRSTLRFIDLSRNSQLLGDTRALNTVIRLIKDAPNLRELHLPWEAANLFNNDGAIRKLEALLLKLRLTSPLVKLEPLSSSALKSFATIQGLLADNRPSPKH